MSVFLNIPVGTSHHITKFYLSYINIAQFYDNIHTSFYYLFMQIVNNLDMKFLISYLDIDLEKNNR